MGFYMLSKNQLNASLEIFILTKSRFILKRAIKKLNSSEYYYCNVTKKIKNANFKNSIKGDLKKNGLLIFQNEDFHFEIHEKDLNNLKHQKI